jgi:hypothetical protein
VDAGHFGNRFEKGRRHPAIVETTTRGYRCCRVARLL